LKPAIVIVTGLSGSGKTVALRALEDIGYFCVDNLPPRLIDSFASVETEAAGIKHIAIGIDVRERAFLHAVDPALRPLRDRYNIEVLFLEADTDVLLRRFKETRRPHPLDTEGRGLAEAIKAETGLLKPLRDSADRIINTSAYTPHELRHIITSLYRKHEGKARMSLTLISFGYKFGIPPGIDLLFDVRFLPNPHFVPELKELKGTDPAVREFVIGNPETETFIGKIAGLLDYLIPLFLKEGRAYLTIGIGCTGGRHRSPAIVEKLAGLIADEDLSVNLVHRDM